MDTNIIQDLMASTSAVCCLTVPVQEYVKDRSEKSIFVVGTAFLVRPTTAITNRHVLLGLKELQTKHNFPDNQLYLWFVYPTATGHQEGYCRIKQYGVVSNNEIDIGFIEFARRPEPEFDRCQPLEVVDQCAPNVGEPIAVCGFPYGVDAFSHRPGEAFFRVGPVLQQGYVSAIVPWNFTRPSSITEIILDIRTAGGMSGAPVVRKNDGIVIGVHYAGIEATMANAIPIDREQLDRWLVAHDAAHQLRGDSSDAG